MNIKELYYERIRNDEHLDRIWLVPHDGKYYLFAWCARDVAKCCGLSTFSFYGALATVFRQDQLHIFLPIIRNNGYEVGMMGGSTKDQWEFHDKKSQPADFYF